MNRRMLNENHEQHNKKISQGRNIMNITDLSDTNFTFKCDFEIDAAEYWDYYLLATVNDYQYGQSMNTEDIECLRNNCKRILEATDNIVNRSH